LKNCVFTEQNEKKKMQTTNGNLLEFPCDVIVQQCNCVTEKPKGLALSIKQAFGICPYGSGVVSEPGSIKMFAVTSTDDTATATTKPRYVACLFAQYYPGKSKYASDSREKRLQWFAECLKKLTEECVRLSVKSVAVPHLIGCGLAQGRWSDYSTVLQAWATENRANFTVHLIQLVPT
jgi:O-acetyl-ADP-ribose deacetylase (regulator of RNase III)